MVTTTTKRRDEAAADPNPLIDRARLDVAFDRILGRHPAVGFAVGVVRGGSVEFRGRGLEYIDSRIPVVEYQGILLQPVDDQFRIDLSEYGMAPVHLVAGQRQ